SSPMLTSCILSSFMIFIFYCFRCHPYLHSFPTRRSSDLLVNCLSTPAPSTRADSYNSSGIWRRPARKITIGEPKVHTFRITRVRSEEHTSELQSRENLVCRLLLEKKNKRTNLQPILSDGA